MYCIFYLDILQKEHLIWLSPDDSKMVYGRCKSAESMLLATSSPSVRISEICRQISLSVVII